MNWGVLALRAKTHVRTLIRAVGIVVVLLGAYNMLISAYAEPVFTSYRQIGIIFVNNGQGGFYLGDVILMALGAAVAWFT